MKLRELLFVALTASGVVQAQLTRVSLANQTKEADFSGAGSTKPFRIGTTLPASCGVGEAFVVSSSGTLYYCLTANSWVELSIGPSGLLPTQAGHGGSLLTTDGTYATWQNVGGDLTGTPASVKVAGLQGRALSGSVPLDGQVLRWNANLLQWEPGVTTPIVAGPGISILGGTVAVEDAIIPLYYQGTGAPAFACQQGRDYFVDTAAADLYFCKAADSWQPVAWKAHMHSAGEISSGSLSEALLPSFAGDVASAAGTASLAVVAVQGRPVAPTAPAPGQVLKWNGGTMLWEPGADLGMPDPGTAGLAVRTGGGSVSRTLVGTNNRLVVISGDGQAGDPQLDVGDHIVDQTTANQYAAGVTQSFQHNGFNTGLRILPAAGDPSAAQDGDIWLNSTTGRLRCRQGGVSADCTPDHLTSYEAVEEFDGGAETSPGMLGRLAWNAQGTWGRQAAVAGHPGVVRLSTGSTPGYAVTSLGIGSAGELFHANDDWTVSWVWRVPGVLDANTNVRIGMSCDAAGAFAPAAGVFLERLAADANWFAVTRKAGTADARTDTGVAAAADTWVLASLKRTSATTVSVVVNGTTVLHTAASNMPVTGCGLWAGVDNNGQGMDRMLDLDFARLNITLAR